MNALRPVVYDAGMLIAADRSDAKAWRAHRAYLTASGIPQVPAPVVAQVWRNGARQARLSMLLKGCDIVPLDAAWARRIGELLGGAGADDPVDASVVTLAAGAGAAVITSDPCDMQRLLDCLGEAGKRVVLRTV